MRKRGLFAISTLAVLAVLLVPTFNVFAWNLGISTDKNCDQVTVTADPDVWFEDHSGQSQIKWVPETVTGTGTFAWGTLQTSMHGTVSVTFRKYTSNNGGNSWTATSVTTIESGNWSVNRPGNCQITICHVSGSAADPANYNTLTISINAALGHFYENGTPKAGHEQDSLGACQPPPPPPVLGCMDPDAINYNPEATQDDGSCQYPPPPVPGCTDPQAANYNPDATEDDGSCEYPEITICYNGESFVVHTNELDQYPGYTEGPCSFPPPDLCSNIDGIQETIPEGYEDPDQDGICTLVPPPPTDLCTNIDGIQTTMPDGYEDPDQDGICTEVPPPPPPTDVCPNIEGNQSEVPDGMIIDAEGNCVEPPPQTDVCPNLEGDQATVPDGMVIDGDGNCVPRTEPDLIPYCLNGETIWLPEDADPPEGATPGACQPPPYHPPEEPATGPEGALPIAQGLAFLAFSGLGAFGIRRMNKK